MKSSDNRKTYRLAENMNKLEKIDILHIKCTILTLARIGRSPSPFHNRRRSLLLLENDRKNFSKFFLKIFYYFLLYSKDIQAVYVIRGFN